MVMLVCALGFIPIVGGLVATGMLLRRTDTVKSGGSDSSNHAMLSDSSTSGDNKSADTILTVDTSDDLTGGADAVRGGVPTSRAGFMALITSATVFVGSQAKTKFQGLQMTSPIGAAPAAKNPMITPAVAV